jgi:hypothetical protein
MPNVRKEIYDVIARELEMRAQRAQMELFKNRSQIRMLSDAQKRLKAEASEAWRLSAQFKGKSKKPLVNA